MREYLQHVVCAEDYEDGVLLVVFLCCSEHEVHLPSERVGLGCGGYQANFLVLSYRHSSSAPQADGHECHVLVRGDAWRRLCYWAE